MPKGKTVFLDVDELNNRVDGKADEPDSDLYSTDQYQFVYVPPHFRFRVFLFILFIWMFAAVTGVGITIVPLVFGRHMFKLLIPAHIRTNDIYAFSIGIYVLGSLTYFVFHAGSIYAKAEALARSARAAVPNEGTLGKAAAVAWHVAKLVYSYFFLLIAFPLLASAVVELYLLIPLDTYMYPTGLSAAAGGAAAAAAAAAAANATPRHTVRVIQTWTLGLLYLKLGARTITTWYHGTRLAAAVRAVLRRGWLQPDVTILTRAFVVPGLALACTAVAWPLVAARMFIDYGGGSSLVGKAELTPAELTLIYRLSFPVAALAAAALWALWGMFDTFQTWKLRIRDEAYLIGERLHNFGVGAGPRSRGGAWRTGGARL